MVEVFLDSPVNVISGGTDNHLFLLDVTPLNITGKWAQERLDHVSITVNKNSIPGDKLSFIETSGIRIGTPAITTRGLKEEDSRQIAKLILKALQAQENELPEIKAEAQKIVSGKPLHAE